MDTLPQTSLLNNQLTDDSNLLRNLNTPSGTSDDEFIDIVGPQTARKSTGSMKKIVPKRRKASSTIVLVPSPTQRSTSSNNLEIVSSSNHAPGTQSTINSRSSPAHIEVPNTASNINVRFRRPSRRHNKTPSRQTENSCRTSTLVGVGRGKGSVRRMRQVLIREKQQQIQIQRNRAISNVKTAIPKATFRRVFGKLFREYIEAKRLYGLKLQAMAFEVIHQVSESYMVQFFETCNDYVMHAGRVTLFVRDIRLYRRHVEPLIEKLFRYKPLDNC